MKEVLYQKPSRHFNLILSTSLDYKARLLPLAERIVREAWQVSDLLKSTEESLARIAEESALDNTASLRERSRLVVKMRISRKEEGAPADEEEKGRAGGFRREAELAIILQTHAADEELRAQNEVRLSSELKLLVLNDAEGIASSKSLSTLTNRPRLFFFAFGKHRPRAQLRCCSKRRVQRRGRARGSTDARLHERDARVRAAQRTCPLARGGQGTRGQCASQP